MNDEPKLPNEEEPPVCPRAGCSEEEEVPVPEEDASPSDSDWLDRQYIDGRNQKIDEAGLEERYSVTYFHPPVRVSDQDLRFACSVDILQRRQPGEGGSEEAERRRTGRTTHLRSHKSVGEVTCRREQVRRCNDGGSGSGSELMNSSVCNVEAPEAFDAVWDFLWPPSRYPYALASLVEKVTTGTFLEGIFGAPAAGSKGSAVGKEDKSDQQGAGANSGWQEVVVDWHQGGVGAGDD